MMYVMCLFQCLTQSGDDAGDLDLSIASDNSPVTTPGAEVRLIKCDLRDPVKEKRLV